MQPTPRDLRFKHVYFPSIINCCDYFSEYLLNILIVMRRWCLKYCVYIYIFFGNKRFSALLSRCQNIIVDSAVLNRAIPIFLLVYSDSWDTSYSIGNISGWFPGNYHAIVWCVYQTLESNTLGFLNSISIWVLRIQWCTVFKVLELSIHWKIEIYESITLITIFSTIIGEWIS